MQAEEEAGKPTAEMVLKEAQSSDSPGHAYFEWDDSLASQNYHMLQADGLVRSIQVKAIGKSGEGN